MTRRFRRLHRLAATVAGTFTLFHLANHLAALGGVDAHIRVMAAFRTVYRHPAVEVVLLASIALLAVSGLTGLRNAWQRPGIARWQAISGAVLGLFFLGHTGAVLAGRALFGLDTNFHFAAAPLNVGWLPVWFVPYYATGIIAVGVHIGAALSWRVARPARVRTLAAPIAVAVLAAVLIVAAFAGRFYPLDIPHDYTAPFDWAR